MAPAAVDRALTGPWTWPIGPSTSSPAVSCSGRGRPCLAQDAGVLLLDEPTTFLDLRLRSGMLDLVRALADGRVRHARVLPVDALLGAQQVTVADTLGWTVIAPVSRPRDW